MDVTTLIASFLSGLLCSMGFGGGSVLIIYLTSYLDMPQKEAQGINLMFFIPCAVYSVIRYNKDKLIVKDVAKPFILWGLIGVAIGYLIINFIPADYLRKLFGGLLILIGLRDLFKRKKSENTEE